MTRIAALGVIVFFALALFSPAAWAGDKPLKPYDVLVVQKFTVAPEVAAKGDFPSGYEDVLQKTLFARLLTERVFGHVVEDVAVAPSPAGKGAAPSPRQELGGGSDAIVMAGEVTEFGKGNRAARVAVGYGAGSSKLKVVLVFRERGTGREVVRLEQTGRYVGFGNLTGGSAQTAQTESARKVVEGLLKKIRAAR